MDSLDSRGLDRGRARDCREITKDLATINEQLQDTRKTFGV